MRCLSLRRSLALALSLLSQRAQAQEPPRYTLPEALAYARAHQPQIRSARAELLARQSEARIPRALWLPRVGATAQVFVGTTNNTTGSYLGVRDVDLPRIGGTRSSSDGSFGPSASTLAALTIDQELFDFGRIAAQAAVADALVDLAGASAESVTLETQLAVEEGWHATLAALEVQHATDEALRRATAHRDYAQAGARSGLRPPIELTRAQAEVAQLEVRRVRAAAGLHVARAALAAAMGHPALEVDARADAASDPGAPAFDEALQIAAARNPAIAAAAARLRAQQAATRTLARELAPNVFASATLSGRAGGAAPSSGAVPYGDGWLPDVANWHVGLVLQWTLFDGGLWARRSASMAREEVARADLDLARSQVTLAVQRAWLDLDASRSALPALDESVRAAVANQAQAEARFRAGLGTSVELADAESLLTNAQLELAIGRFSVARARSTLARVVAEPSQAKDPR